MHLAIKSYEKLQMKSVQTSVAFSNLTNMTNTLNTLTTSKFLTFLLDKSGFYALLNDIHIYKYD